MKSNSVMLIVFTIVLAGGAYWYVSTRTGNELPLTALTGPENAARTQFQALVSQLRSISFDTDIFSDPRFTSLVDLSTPVTPEPPGRLDPFGQVSGAAGI
ncbi:MAG: hypothetical protein WAV50_01625 [Minisyncoccia bacterium]